jgi:hypothetical protein
MFGATKQLSDVTGGDRASGEKVAAEVILTRI